MGRFFTVKEIIPGTPTLVRAESDDGLLRAVYLGVDVVRKLQHPLIADGAHPANWPKEVHFWYGVIMLCVWSNGEICSTHLLGVRV